jgi:hypothetical protein
MMKMRIVMAAFALLSLLPFPTAAAGSSCHSESFGPGTGQVWFSSTDDPKSAKGDWVDGCGGNACDDHVIGSFDWNGKQTSFSVDEVSGSRDNCGVKCTLGNGDPTDDQGWVKPYHDGSSQSVLFTCGDWLNGSLGLNAKDLSAYVMYALPSISG